jgi:hypothetical protein
MDAPKTMDGQDWGMLILLSVLWGGAYFFAGVAVKELPPLTVVLARVSLAAIALLPVFWYFGHALPRSLSCWLPFLGMGLLNNVLPFGFIFAGQTQITVGLSSIINHQRHDAVVHRCRDGFLSGRALDRIPDNRGGFGRRRGCRVAWI